MSDPDVVATTAEAYAAHLAQRLLSIRRHECLTCYSWRMISQFGCNNTMRFTIRWRDLQMPSATELEDDLARRGACCCDCEIFLNVYTVDPTLQARGSVQRTRRRPSQPDCATVNPPSTQPCRVWVPLRMT